MSASHDANTSDALESTKRVLLDLFNKFYDLSAQGVNANGIVGLESVQELAQDYLKGSGTLLQKVNRLIRNQNLKAACTGFITNVGGIVTLPVSIPADLACTFWVQIRMIQAIAYMCGEDIKSDDCKTLVLISFCGMSIAEAAIGVIVNVGTAVGRKAVISAISKQTIGKINAFFGVKLLTRFGTRGIIKLGYAVPIFGGLLGSGISAIAMDIAGNIARKNFLEDKKLENYTGTVPPTGS